ncbi:MAG: ISKra4 family transposase [Planctomycetaceae bacterium]|nr:ISKra4 family transposase [Planctomycetaceae bacterium]
MIIEVEDRFYRVAKAFSQVLGGLQRAAARGEAVHAVEEMAWSGLIETGRQMIAAYIEQQEEDLPRPEVIEQEGKQLHRLPARRTRSYVSAFGLTPFERDVYATRETQRQEVVPLDAKLGMPESDTSYLLQKWSGVRVVKESYQESQGTLRDILGFAPSVNCLEDIAARASEHAEVYFDQQEPVDPTTEAEIKEKQEQRPEPQNKRLRAVLTREVDGKEINAKDVIFDWLASEVGQRDPHEQRTVVAVMDGETKLRDLQELKIQRAIGILDIWHVTEYLWKVAYCFHLEGSDAAEAFVETYLRKLLQGKVNRVIGGIRQMATKRGDLSKHKTKKLEQYLDYFTERREYMKYDEYLAAGYPIGSGVVEGACRHLVKDRMEQTDMRWRIAGAQAILSLRAIYVNDDWDAFHANRIQTEQPTLYPCKKRLNVILNCAT